MVRKDIWKILSADPVSIEKQVLFDRRFDGAAAFYDALLRNLASVDSGVILKNVHAHTRGFDLQMGIIEKNILLKEFQNM